MDATGETIDLEPEEADNLDTELNKEEEDNMEEAEKETVETPAVETTEAPKEEAKVETPSEEKLDVKAIQAGITENAKSIKVLADLMTKKITEEAEETEVPAPSAEVEGKEIPEPVKDETQGDVGGEAEAETTETEEGFILEKADVGRGLQISRDYSKSTGKFNRLCR